MRLADPERWGSWGPAVVITLGVVAVTLSPYALGLPWALLALGCLAAATVAARFLRFDTGRMERWLESGLAPVVAGILTGLVVLLVWGSLRGLPVIHDEASYLFQARLFAEGRWSAPSPPLPSFFEQYHMLVVPRYLSKYDPGHALLLAPGVLVGLPGLMPVLLSAIAGGLVFTLARRLSGPWVGLLTWGFWVTAGANLRHRPTYLSEVTTSALLLAAWYALLRWRESRATGWLVAVSLCLSWGAITRPMTMLAAGIPIAAVVLRDIIRGRRVKPLATALVAGLAVLAILPLWNLETMGDWRRSPRSHYTDQYLPFDLPGFGPETTPYRRAGAPDFGAYDAYYRGIRAEHTVAALPATVAQRLHMIGFEMWGGWRAGLAPLALVGLFLLPAGGGLAVLTTALVVAGYATYYAPSYQLAYYLEVQPVLAFCTTVGLWWLARRVLERRDGRPPGASARFAIIIALLAVWPAWLDIGRARGMLAHDSALVRRFREAVDRLPADKAIVFLRYPPDTAVVQSVMGNEPDLNRARVWVVYDRGEENRRLERLAPDRAPYVYDITLGRMLDRTETGVR